MITVLLQALALAAVGILSPGSITMIILLLMSDKGWRSGVAYMAGYLVMYSVIGSAVLIWGFDSAEPTASEPSTLTSAFLVGLGLLLLLVSLRNWRKPAAEKDPTQPSRFSKIVDGITPLKAFAFGALVTFVNAKNLAIFLSAVSVLLWSSLALTTKLAMLAPVVFVFCLSVIVPVAIYFAFPAQATEYLTRIKQTIDRYSRPLGLIVPSIIGALLLYRGITGLL